jgi:hypothetical protein
MAHYVVLSFEDDDDAKAFAQHELFEPGDQPWDVVALIRKPTKFCEGHPKGRRALGFTRGQRWGWWVCDGCKKPSRLWAASYKGVISMGRNLLIADPKDDKNPPAPWELKQVIKDEDFDRNPMQDGRGM